MLRESSRQPGSFVLTMIGNQRIHNFHVEAVSQYFFFCTELNAIKIHTVKSKTQCTMILAVCQQQRFPSEITTQPSHSLYRVGWQAKMVSIALWIQAGRCVHDCHCCCCCLSALSHNVPPLSPHSTRTVVTQHTASTMSPLPHA